MQLVEIELGPLLGLGIWEWLIIGVGIVVAVLVVAALVKYLASPRR